MGKVIGGKTLSVDGFASDPNGDVGQLYPDLVNLAQTEVLQEEMRNPAQSSWGSGRSRWGSGLVRGQLRVSGADLRADASHARRNSPAMVACASSSSPTASSAVAQAKPPRATKTCW
ncbi:hypothetical protein [Candidatus Flexifilum breve]|uniref:hypothetical protein n=1 Tax=Candidatus Flexifilum breve TaxID=3140694 RepID=UPI0031CCC5E5